MKNTLLILFILVSFESYSQILKEKELAKISSFGVALTNYNLNDKQVINDWKLILKKDNARKKNKTAGIVFTSLSILSTAFGARLISVNKDSEEGLGQSIGMMFVVGGITSAGISIPLFISTNKKKKERNKLLELYNHELLN